MEDLAGRGRADGYPGRSIDRGAHAGVGDVGDGPAALLDGLGAGVGGVRVVHVGLVAHGLVARVDVVLGRRVAHPPGLDVGPARRRVEALLVLLDFGVSALLARGEGDEAAAAAEALGLALGAGLGLGRGGGSAAFEALLEALEYGNGDPEEQGDFDGAPQDLAPADRLARVSGELAFCELEGRRNQ